MPYTVKTQASSAHCDLNAPELGNGVVIPPDFAGTRATVNLKDPTEVPFDIRIESPKLIELEIVTQTHLRCNIVLASTNKELNLRIRGIDCFGTPSGEETKITIKEDTKTPTSGRVVTLVLDRIGPHRDSHLPWEVAQDVENKTTLRLISGVALNATVRECSNCTIVFAGIEDLCVIRNLVVTDSAIHGFVVENSITVIENFALESMSTKAIDITSPVVRCTLSKSSILGGRFLPESLVRLEVPKYVKLQDTIINIGLIEFACLDRSNLDLSDADYVDQWNILRDNYTGARFFINLLFLVLYCLPLFSRVVVYWGMGAVENAGGRGDLVPEGWIEQSVAEILFFGTSGNETIRWTYFILAMSVLVYQGLRLYLTIIVSSLREREEHMDAKGYKNTRPPYDKLTSPYVLHRFMKYLLLLALASVIWRVVEVLIITVHVPAT